MKLINKKTGKILEDVKYIDTSLTTIEIHYLDNGVSRIETEKDYHSFLQNWEDYDTPQEPLIKDEKIRKALRVWADENRIKKVGFKLDNGNTSCACYFYDESCDICEFGLKFYLAIDADKIYTITELCGEEEW